MKIGIAGCSGTGKSILAQRLAAELEVPFLPSKEITSDILERDGFDYASGEQVEKFLSTHSHQKEILKRTKEQQSIESFVSDRTAIDLASYAIMEMEGPLDVQRYIDECAKMATSYDYIFFCPWEGREILDNNKRTLDPWYQFAVHSVQQEVMGMFNIPRKVLTKSDVGDRVSEAMGYISGR